MNNFLTRTLTGTLYLVIFIGAILSGPYGFGLLFFAIVIISLWEFYQMAENLGFHPGKFMGLITGAAFFVLAFVIFAFGKSFILLDLIVPLLVIAIIAELYLKRPNPLVNISITMLGLLYVALPLTLFNHLAFYDNGNYTFEIILGFFILLWVNDTAAYVFGMLFGKHRLFERISPKKSWEGFAGGTLATLTFAFFLNLCFDILTRTDWLVIGALIAVAGVYGDLVESMFKRSANIKDSGKILPGHGGMLDRIDSVLLSSPLVFTYLLILNLLQS
ncbi:MAG: phosphatidate cytidylyltransferase [Bacteroidales bacterium]|nr:phosphatidate cytidylyltransferase [Bacteroidales bacterium]